MTVSYSGSIYYYVTNLQGDVIAILDSSGTAVVEYTYDAWGKPLATTGNMANTLGIHNPLRYRGYVYDRETGLYYLQSRYYNPEWGRFISSDGLSYLGANGDLTAYNLYAYCSNNPVNCFDPNGHFVISLSALVIGMAISAAIGAGIGLGATVYQDYSDDGEIFNGSVGMDEYIGNTAGGLIAGAGIGACTVLGAGLGAAIAAGETLMLSGITLSGVGALGLSAGIAFSTGAAGYATRTSINLKEDFEMSDMLIAAGVNTASGMLSFVGGVTGGITGVKVPGAKNGFGNFAKYHGAMAYFGVYPTKYLLSRIKTALQEAY